MSAIKKYIFAIFSVLIFCAIIATNTVVLAANVELEQSIENSINEVLKKYIDTIDVESEVEKVIDQSIKDFVKTIDVTKLETALKENILNALSGHLHEIQAEFEKTIENKTYDITRELLNQKVKSQVEKELRNAINIYNNSRFENDSEGNSYEINGFEIISEEQANNIVTDILNKMQETTDVGNFISSNIKNGTEEYINLGSLITDYLYVSDEQIKSAKEQGIDIEKVDRLANYINGANIIDTIQSKINIEMTDELKQMIKDSIKEYLQNSSGKAIFNDIKTGIYYYIQENGGFDEVMKNGFSEETSKSITNQIGKIVASNIQYRVSPYVTSLSEAVMEKTIKELSYYYIDNGVFTLIKDSVPQAVSKLFQKEFGEILRTNFANCTDSYLKGLVNNSTVRNEIDARLAYYCGDNIGQRILSNVGTKYVYDGDGAPSYEVEADVLTYAKNTIFPTIKNAIQANMVEYMNGDKGIVIKNEAIKNVNEVLTTEVLEKLVVEINKNICIWIEKGIVADTSVAINDKIYQYLKEIEESPEEFSSETGVILGDIIKEVRYNPEASYGRIISFEELTNSQSLFSADRGAIIPAKDSQIKPLDDATVEAGSSTYKVKVPVYELSAWNLIIPNAVATMDSFMDPYMENPFGVIGRPAGLSRTLAKYKTNGIKTLEPEEAYVLSHQKDTSVYPDKVQLAYWNILEYVHNLRFSQDEGIIDKGTYNLIAALVSIANGIYDTESITDGIISGLKSELLGYLEEAGLGLLQGKVDGFLPWQSEKTDDKTFDNPISGLELFEEAKYLGEALDNWNEFKEKNDGKILVDKTDYEKTEVSYSKNTDNILVGPFTIDYIREFYLPISSSDSEMVDPETGIISYTGIVNADLYADDSKTTKINNWEFVYPDKRVDVPKADGHYKYPYPNEVFYFKFPSTENYSINTLSRMTFKMEKMDADGQTYDLRGTYNQLLWVAAEIPIQCPLPPARCACPLQAVGGHAMYPTGYCPPVKCLIHKIKYTPIYHIAGDGHLLFKIFFMTRATVGSNLHAQNLEELIYAKIYKEYQTIEVELGEVKPYYSNSVNPTSNQQTSENKGNIKIDSEEVPVLPFLPNYEQYPGYPGYPDYPNSPNYPNNPYYFDNLEYKDYPSYPYYSNDPTYPYYPNNKIIPLTFHIEGTVWLDNPGGTEKEINGIIDQNERGIPNVEVVLYKKDNPNYIAKTLTNKEGKYIFEYVRVGFDYYVEFVYDGITYKTTKYMQNQYTERNGEDFSEINTKYKNHPENYLTSSHAIENSVERDKFNDKFYHISENVALAKDGNKISLEYQTWNTKNGAVSTLITADEREITKKEFKMYAKTSETSLYFPLDDQYQVDFADLDLFKDKKDYYIKTYPGLEHINLGLVKREQGDFEVKTDAYQVITTIKEDIQRYKYNQKTTEDSTYDILYRGEDYYTKNPYNQEINPDDHAYKYDQTYGENAPIVGGILSPKDELNIYIEYKLLIRNNGTKESGKIIEIENSFDKNLEYISKYDFTNLASWIEVPMNGSDETTREEILWDYRPATENGYSTIYTDDLANKDIKTGEVVEVHIILKVKEDAARNPILDLTSNSFKENISEVTIYEYKEGLFDKTSNPGSARLGNPRTYADGTDTAPLLKLIFTKEYGVGNTITGYAWDDLVEGALPKNNQIISNGLKDERETKINDIKVELIEVVTNKETGKEVEVLRKTASGTDFYRTGENITVDGKVLDIKDGEYKFTKLETGIFRIKFTYGDEYQLSKNLKYNAQDYKTLALDTIRQHHESPIMEVMFLMDTSSGMKTNNKEEKMRKAIIPLLEDLYKNVQTVKVGATLFSEPSGTQAQKVDFTNKPDMNNILKLFEKSNENVGTTLERTIDYALGQFGKDTEGKVIVILTDGYMQNISGDKAALQRAQKAGVKVVTIACSTDEWDKSTFGTEDRPTAGNLYNIREGNIPQYISEVVLEDILLEFESILPNLTDAKDVEDKYLTASNSKVGDIYSRKRNIDYSSVITNENAEVLDIDTILELYKKLEKAKKDEDKNLQEKLVLEINNKTKQLAEETKTTAITPNRNILFSHKAQRTEEVNLGLVERPKMEIKLEEKVERIQVILSNGEVIIDTEKDLTQNVQVIKNEKYAIFMDEEIMQGAKIVVDYKITITNNGLVDTLADYFTYDMFNPTEVAKSTRTVPSKIGRIYNYYTNNSFRAEDNNNLEIEVNDVKLDKLNIKETTITNWDKLISRGEARTPLIDKITTRVAKDKRAIVLDETLTWENSSTIKLNPNIEKAIDKDKIKIVETKSLRNTELFPNISREALAKTETSSINIYVQYSKTLSGKDTTDTLQYKNSTEIVERLNEVGRRDYIAIPGNYKPHDKVITEYDANIAEEIIILPPFGANKAKYYILATTIIIIFAGGVIFIKRRVL